MSDREKVIKGLDEITHYNGEQMLYNDIFIRGIADDALSLLKEQAKRINELEEKLRLLEYGDQDTLQSGMMPAT